MITAAVIVGWLLLGLATARVMYVTGAMDEWMDDSPFEALMVTLFWPLVWVALLAAGVVVGTHRLVTLPTRRERLERRRKQAADEAQRVASQARELGLPTVD